ncbi:MAG: substrate-binding domain-containing protein, partial [Sphaerochaetaceae bacterium]|nr:substrate-binding domain-containing protein [Sphaerochaetaceae bacterium]
SNTPIATSCYPELTTINQHPTEAGRVAASIICKLIGHKKVEQQESILKTELIVRESCTSPTA